LATSEAKIGIKIADGTFYPVLDEGRGERKRLVLTTVKDNQQNVQIDLYRSQEERIEGADYIGSLVIEEIPASPKGEPEVEVVIGIDSDGNLNAVATESKTGSRQSLSTALENLGEEGTYDIPEFELDDDLSTENLSEMEDEEDLTGDTYPIEDRDRRRDRLEKKRNPLFAVLFVLLGLLIIAGLTFLIFQLLNRQALDRPIEVGRGSETAEERVEPPQAGGKSTEGAGEAEGQAQAGAKESGGPTQAQESGEKSGVPKQAESETAAQGQGDGTATKIEAEKKKPQDSSEGVWYTIRWGDTLWHIAAAYYRNPLLYPRIARHPKNNIRNPDFIMAGFRLFIPKN
jgi:nucleoid-associated protein YgaU